MRNPNIKSNTYIALIFICTFILLFAIIGMALLLIAQNDTITITTSDYIDVTNNSAAVNVSTDIRNKDTITEVGLFYGNSPDALSCKAPFTGAYTNDFTITIWELKPETTYYYQAYAEKSNGNTVLGSIKAFITSPDPRQELIAQTLPAVDIVRGELETPVFASQESNKDISDETHEEPLENNWSVTLRGSVSGTNIVEYGFYYGTNRKNLTESIQLDEWHENAQMNIQLTNLTHKVTYYYQAYAIDDIGSKKVGDTLYVTMADSQSYDMWADDYVHYESYKEKLRLYCVDGDYNYAFFINPMKESSINVDPEWIDKNIIKAPLFSDREFLINKLAYPKFQKAVDDINSTKIKITYNDLTKEFMLSDLIFTENGVTSFRYIGGSKSLSNHSFGLAIDINASIDFNDIRYRSDARANYQLLEDATNKLSFENTPLDDGKTVELRYNDIAPVDKLIPDELINYLLYELAFKEQGFYWGGYYKNVHDAMHYDLVTLPSRSGIPLTKKEFD